VHGARTAYDGNPYIGMFCRSTEKFTFVPVGTHPKLVSAFSVLGTEIVKLSISGSPFIGLYIAANSNGIVLPYMAEKFEITQAKETGLSVHVSREMRCALGNNVLANDHGCVINSNVHREEAKKIAECLGVPFEQAKIAGFETVGSAAFATNKGFLCHNEAAESDLALIESVLKVKGTNGTLNMGSPFVGQALVANSKGYVVGESTSGYELGKVESALGFLD